MFFIGFFGVNGNAKPAGQLSVGRCPVCGSEKPLAVTHRYQSFHAFLIPLFRFHSEYFATCPHCASLFDVPDWCGKAAERDGVFTTDAANITLLRRPSAKCCPGCGAPVDRTDAFCRSCGHPL